MNERSMSNTGIYKIKNIINNDCYIGSASYTFNKRWNTHKHQLKNNKHHSIILQRAWNKYGENNFNFEIIEYCEPYECLIKEQHYLDNLKPKYNINPNAESPLGRKLKPEDCKKISDRTSGIKNPFFGKHHTEETKKLLSIQKSKPIKVYFTDGTYTTFSQCKYLGIHLGKSEHLGCKLVKPQFHHLLKNYNILRIERL